MTPPARIWHVEWIEGGDRAKERRFKKAERAARQVAPILAAPDAVAQLRGVWVSDGWNQDRIEWTRVEPSELLAGVAVADDESELEGPMSALDWHDRIASAWRDHDERSTT